MKASKLWPENFKDTVYIEPHHLYRRRFHLYTESESTAEWRKRVI